MYPFYQHAKPIAEDATRQVFAGHATLFQPIGHSDMGACLSEQHHRYARIRRKNGRRVMEFRKTPKRDYRPVTLVMK